jgi:tetratricopeptide (TPR) repeat protein
MKSSQKSIYDIIEDYCNEASSLEEKIAFESRLKKDSNLNKVVQQYQLLIWGIKTQARKDILNELKAYEKTLPVYAVPKSSNYNNKFKNFLAVAAGIVIAVITTLTIYLNFDTNRYINEIYATHYQPYPNIIHAITRGENSNDDIEKMAYHAYEQMKYEEAIMLFKKLPNENINGGVIFYIGSAYLANGEVDKAIEYFKSGLEKYQEFTIQATWYLGLAYLKANRLEKAKETFQNVADQNNSYSNRAQEILDKLATRN